MITNKFVLSVYPFGVTTSLLLLCSLSLAGEYDDIGILDRISGDQLVVSDTFHSISNLVDCYDERGQRLVTCSSLKVGTYVGLQFNDAISRDSLKVESIHSLSESKFKALNND